MWRVAAGEGAELGQGASSLNLSSDELSSLPPPRVHSTCSRGMLRARLISPPEAPGPPRPSSHGERQSASVEEGTPPSSWLTRALTPPPMDKAPNPMSRVTERGSGTPKRQPSPQIPSYICGAGMGAETSPEAQGSHEVEQGAEIRPTP